ncbi:RDD family protein [Adhaeretor mobilis]|uniref:RDD family protein n=1 Tax=Adhaeretor mobilis TaxID=1930276 RepID=A0A517MQR3_9BACT|nr:RDD family protein [Adhaeretor mobilis]QDS97221.1 RDD family protein [Adhaeretor mobilis]
MSEQPNRMNERIAFETPENIKISYQLAGPGTRFLAWFADSIFLTLFCLVLLVVFIAVGVSFDGVLGDVFEPGTGSADFGDDAQFSMVFLGIWLMIWSLGSLFYFGLSELFLRGQTIGKRMSKIRVVKSDGFSLDPLSILIRSLFRIVDQIPVLWIVPVLSTSSQRLGDMVAGTIVVSEEPDQVSSVREVLSSRPASDNEFRFTVTMLKRAQAADFAAIESILERWSSLSTEEQSALTGKIVPALAQRLQSELPPLPDHQQYLEDLLAAEYRRQSRNLG